MPLAAPLALVAACGAEPEAPSKLDQAAPNSAYSDAATAISLLGGPFRPPVEVDTRSGAAEVGTSPFKVFLAPVLGAGSQMENRTENRTISATDPHWRSNLEIDARFPAGLSPGEYRVEMMDPRGQSVRSTARFTSLGPDIDPPTITFLQPVGGTAVGAAAKVSVAVQISDGVGHVRAASWSATSPSMVPKDGVCPIPEDQPSDVHCYFDFITADATTNLEQITIVVDAEDSVQNRSSASLAIRVAWRPNLIAVDPPAGPTTGGTNIVVTGTGFLSLSEVLIDGLPLHGGMVNGGTISATTAPHEIPGDALLQVANGGSLSAPIVFKFVAPPKVRELSPTHGSMTGWTQVTVAGNHFRPETAFYWTQNGQQHPFEIVPPPDPPPPTPLSMFINENRVSLTVPPGYGVIWITAVDPISGPSDMPIAFTYDDPIP